MVINNSLRFLLPLVVDDKSPTELFVNPSLVGVFMADIDKPEYDNNLIIVFKISTDSELLAKSLFSESNGGTEYPHFESKYYPDEDLVAFAFSLEEFNVSHDAILNGLYSTLTTEARGKIVKFWHLDKNNSIYKELFKGKEKLLRYFSGLNDNKGGDLINEVFDINRMPHEH
jgi:hypothetical protein